MKGSIFAVAAAMAAGVSASAHGHAHAHKHAARGHPEAPAMNGTCTPECYTVWQYEWEGKTYTVPSPTYPSPAPSTAIVTKSMPVVPVPEQTTTKKTTITSTSTVKPVFSTYYPPETCPTPIVTVCPTPGTYTIPPTTVTITKETTVCGATTTKVPAGPATYGGVVTVVLTSTTVTCPYAHVTTNTGVVTSTILTTTYVCPSAGTYTPVPPTTTSCPVETIIVYPTPKTYSPGCYTAPGTVVTATETDYVYYCPLESSTYIPAPTYAAPVTTTAPAVVYTTPAAKPYSKPSKPSTPSTSGGGSGELTIETNGNQWAMTYTPYLSDSQGGCKSRDDVFSDIEIIKKAGFTTIRLYSTDCSGLQNVGDACAASGMKMILGVFIDSAGISKAQQQVTDLSGFSHWDLVVLVVVGNEAVFNGFCSASDLMNFVSSCRSAFEGCGYSGKITITEPLDTWQANAATFCPGVDIVGANLHPFFNSATPAELAGTFLLGQLTIADGLCPGKKAYTMETGWPHNGICNGDACPSPQNQKTAIDSILSLCGDRSVIFSYSNDLWKPNGQFECEQSWGAIDLFTS